MADPDDRILNRACLWSIALAGAGVQTMMLFVHFRLWLPGSALAHPVLLFFVLASAAATWSSVLVAARALSREKLTAFERRVLATVIALDLLMAPPLLLSALYAMVL